MTRRVVLLTLGVTSLVVIAFLVPLLSLVRDVAASRATLLASVQAQSAAALVNLTTDQGAALSSTLQTQPNTTVFHYADGRLSGVAGCAGSTRCHGRRDGGEPDGRHRTRCPVAGRCWCRCSAGARRDHRGGARRSSRMPSCARASGGRRSR